MKQRALVLIDIQNDYFPGGAFPLPAMGIASQNAAQLLSWARANQIRIVHVRHEELDPTSEFLKAKSSGTDIHNVVAPGRGEVVMTKNFPNAFRESGLQESLAGINEVIIAGAMSNMCIDSTARAAFDLGFEIIIAHDACAACDAQFNGKSISAEDVHVAFMASLAAGYGRVSSVNEILSG